MKVPPFDIATAAPELQARLAKRPALNLYKALPYAGALAPRFLDMGAAIRNELTLDPRLRELAIIRVGCLTNADYEVRHHKRIGAGVGVSEAQLEHVDHWREAPTNVFDTLECRVLEYADALTKGIKAPAHVFDDLLQELGAQRLAELTLTIGFYLLVTRFLLNFEIDLEPEYL